MTHTFSWRAAFASALAAVLVAGCREATGPSGGREATLRVSASVAGTPISTLVVEVTAADITTPLVFNIEIVNGVASGTITIPAGSTRRITVRGFDANGVETHRGSATVTVRPGPNPSVSITLAPLQGDQPIVITLSSITVTVTPATATLPTGQTLQLAAAVTDASGNPVAAQVAWATLNPALATVSQTGLVTAVAPGQTQIVATFAGVGGAATITVTAPTQLAFTAQPQSTPAGSLLPAVQVTIEDAFGNLVPSATDPVTVEIAPGTGRPGAVLSGTLTVNAVAGVAAFSDLSISAAGTGYRLRATSGSLTPATSDAFDVLPGNVASAGSVSAGELHTCGFTVTGAAYCWGWNSDGQLGDGSTGTNRNTPVAVTGGLTFAWLSADYASTCGVTPGGAAYCWGDNFWGQLGDGSTTDRNAPVAVAGELSFASIDAGIRHTCGVTTSGAAYCWGENSAGQLGDGSTTNRLTPVAVSGGLTFASISAGDWHTCGVTTGGAAYCWGWNNAGQVGDGSTTERLTPTLVSAGLSFASIGVGDSYTCGVTTSGAAYCWGDNPYGQLGDGSTTDRSAPAAVSGGLSFVSISAGGGWHTCGVTTSEAAYCWGWNGNGQLGDGSTTDRLTPVAVSGGLAFASISAGGWHTCGVTTGGAAYCWGRNDTGSLGDDSWTRRVTPVAVAGGLQFP